MYIVFKKHTATEQRAIYLKIYISVNFPYVTNYINLHVSLIDNILFFLRKKAY